MRLIVCMFAAFVLLLIASAATPAPAAAQDRVAGGGNDVANLRVLSDEEVARMPGRVLPTLPIRWHGANTSPRNPHKVARVRMETRSPRAAVRRSH